MIASETAHVLAQLKGMPLTILLTMCCSTVLPIGETDISAVLGTNEKTVRKHLNFLQFHGYVYQVGRYEGWQITDGTKQLPLPVHSLAGGATAVLDDGKNSLDITNGKSYRSRPSSSSSSSNVERNGFLEEEEERIKTNGKSYRSELPFVM